MFRKLLKKGEPFVIMEKMKEEFTAAKVAIGRNILLNSFDLKRQTYQIYQIF